MSNSSGWPIPITGYDSLRIVTKRVDRQARNASPISAADLLGPGMSSQAVHILDWNDEVATFNGFFYTSAGALNAPVILDVAEDPIPLPWIGTVIARQDGTGTQQVWNTDDPGSMWFRVRNYAPNPVDVDGPVIFGDWQRFATRSGFIAEEDLHPDVRDDIDQALEDAAAGLGLAEAVNKVYRQAAAPTNPDVDGRALVVNDPWFDTDDTNRPYRWSGSAWVDATESWLTTNPTSSYPNVVISPAGLVAYSAAGTAVTVIDSSNGFLTTVGSVFANGDISGSTVTGGVVQTDATPEVGVKMNSLGFVAYDAVGDPTFVITASTGAVTMKGDLTSGSTITGAAFVGGTITGTSLSSVDADGTSGGAGGRINPTGLTIYSGGVITGLFASNGTLFVDQINSLFGGVVAMIDDVSITGNLSVSGSFPTSWVGFATSALDMNSHQINDVSSLSVNGAITAGGGVTASGAGHFDTVYADSVPTTGNPINAVMGASGQFLKSTSARRYKYADEPYEVDLATVRELTHKRFRRYDDPSYDEAHPEVGRWYYGVIANEAEALGLTPWCTYDEVGELQSFDYVGFAAAVALATAREVGDLTTRIELLEAS